MKSSRDDKDYLQDILDYALAWDRIAEGLDFETFKSNEEKVFSGIHVIVVIGEAVKWISPTLKAEHTEVPWKEIARMRDKLIHAYHVVDLEVVWRTLINDLPALRESVKTILEELDQ